MCSRCAQRKLKEDNDRDGVSVIKQSVTISPINLHTYVVNTNTVHRIKGDKQSEIRKMTMAIINPSSWCPVFIQTHGDGKKVSSIFGFDSHLFITS